MGIQTIYLAYKSFMGHFYSFKINAQFCVKASCCTNSSALSNNLTSSPVYSPMEKNALAL